MFELFNFHFPYFHWMTFASLLNAKVVPLTIRRGLHQIRPTTSAAAAHIQSMRYKRGTTGQPHPPHSQQYLPTSTRALGPSPSPYPIFEYWLMVKSGETDRQRQNGQNKQGTRTERTSEKLGCMTARNGLENNFDFVINYF